jgi:hypothetical protein
MGHTGGNADAAIRQDGPPPHRSPEEDNMCYPVKCPHCGKTTWDGCGQHVDEVKAAVPPAQWCTCPRD